MLTDIVLPAASATLQFTGPVRYELLAMLQSEVVGAGIEIGFATINPPSVSMSVLLSMSP